MTEGKRFVASFSTGKDSTLAVYKAIERGMKPDGLLITYNEDLTRAWFHSITEDVLKRYSKALGIPIHLIRTSGDDYEENFEKKLKECRASGAEVCVFGDIDILTHLEWGQERCKAAGLEAFYPLWQMDRRHAVNAFLDSGFSAYITIIDTGRVPEEYLGKKLSKELLSKMEEEGIDPCGESGEFHTLVTDGPLFKHPFEYAFGRVEFDGRYAKLPVL